MSEVAKDGIKSLCLPWLESVASDMLSSEDEGVRYGGGEETGECRWYYLCSVLNEPFDDLFVAERVVFDIYLSYKPDDGCLYGGVGEVRESCNSLSHESSDGSVVALFDEWLNGLEIMVVELSCSAFYSFAGCGRIIELGKGVSEEDGL